MLSCGQAQAFAMTGPVPLRYRSGEHQQQGAELKQQHQPQLGLQAPEPADLNDHRVAAAGAAEGRQLGPAPGGADAAAGRTGGHQNGTSSSPMGGALGAAA